LARAVTLHPVKNAGRREAGSRTRHRAWSMGHRVKSKVISFKFQVSKCASIYSKTLNLELGTWNSI
jgi:hypothetical protein